MLHSWIDMKTTPKGRGCLLGNRSTEESKARAVPSFVQALVNSKSALWPSEMSTLKRNSAAYVAKEVNEERLSVPREPKGHRLGLSIVAHRRQPGDLLLPQPFFGASSGLGCGVERLTPFAAGSVPRKLYRWGTDATTIVIMPPHR